MLTLSFTEQEGELDSGNSLIADIRSPRSEVAGQTRGHDSADNKGTTSAHDQEGPLINSMADKALDDMMDMRKVMTQSQDGQYAWLAGFCIQTLLMRCMIEPVMMHCNGMVTVKRQRPMLTLVTNMTAGARQLLLTMHC